MFVRVFCETAGQEAAPGQVTGLGVSPSKGLRSMGSWEVPPGDSKRLWFTGPSYECFSERSATSHHPLCFSCRRSWMCKAGLLRCLCFPINKVDARINASALVLDGSRRKTVVWLYKQLCWLKNWGSVKEIIPSARLCSAVGARKGSAI